MNKKTKEYWKETFEEVARLIQGLGIALFFAIPLLTIVLSTDRTMHSIGTGWAILVFYLFSVNLMESQKNEH